MESQGMKNAKKILEKLGWSEGNGLGLNNDGITEAVKPSGKFNLSGIGHKTYNDFQWWDHAFNKAAQAFDVKITDDQGVIVEKTQKMDKIKTKKGHANIKDGDLAYGVFHKTGTLHNGVVEATETTVTLKEETDYSLKLSDEELFKLCNGLTAHKGARHGLTASGKLARIAQQEAELLAKMSKSDLKEVAKNEKTKNKDRKKKKKVAESEVKVEVENVKEPIAGSCLDDISQNENQSSIKKRKKRSRKDCENSLFVQSENMNSTSTDISVVSEMVTSEKKKKKKKKDKEQSCEIPNLLTEETKVDQSCCDKPKKKKKKHSSLDS